MDDFLGQPLHKIALKSVCNIKKSVPDGPESVLKDGKGVCRGIEYLITGGLHLSSNMDKNDEYLGSGITQISTWLKNNADSQHTLFLGINFQDVKDAPGENKFKAGAIESERFLFDDRLYAYLSSYLNKANLYTPKQLMDWFYTQHQDGDEVPQTLLEGVKKYGWPPLEKIGSRIIVFITGENLFKFSYAYKFNVETSPFFYDVEVKSYDNQIVKDDSIDKNAVIYSFNTNYERGECVDEKGLKKYCCKKRKLMKNNLLGLKEMNVLLRIYAMDANDDGGHPIRSELECWDYALNNIGCNILSTTHGNSEQFLLNQKSPDSPYCIVS